MHKCNSFITVLCSVGKNFNLFFNHKLNRVINGLILMVQVDAVYYGAAFLFYIIGGSIKS